MKASIATAQQPSHTTVATYQKVLRQIQEQAAGEAFLPVDEQPRLTPMDLVAYLKRNPTNLRPRTLVLRKSALLWSLRESPATTPAITDAVAALTQWNPLKEGPVDIPIDRASRSPARMIPQEDLETLCNKLLLMGEWGARAQYMLLAGVVCGPRPIEWVHASWVAQDVVRIFTAKVKNRNAWGVIPPGTFADFDELNPAFEANKPYARQSSPKSKEPSWGEVDFERRLSEANLDFEANSDLITALRKSRVENSTRLFRDIKIGTNDAMVVVLHLAEVKRALTLALGQDYESLGRQALEEGFRKHYYHPIRNVLWRACKDVFPDGRLYGLADARSTFSANRKKMLGTEQTALDMGHNGSTTTKGSYASARLGWNSVSPVAKVAARQSQKTSPPQTPKAPRIK